MENFKLDIKFDDDEWNIREVMVGGYNVTYEQELKFRIDKAKDNPWVLYNQFFTREELSSIYGQPFILGVEHGVTFDNSGARPQGTRLTSGRRHPRGVNAGSAVFDEMVHSHEEHIRAHQAEIRTATEAARRAEQSRRDQAEMERRRNNPTMWERLTGRGRR